MTDYVKSTNFTSKDSLATGNPLKIIKGSEFDIEFNAIATAVATKADLNSPALIGTPTAPTATQPTNTTQVATTAFAMKAAYPVGSIYMNASDSTNPGTLFGFGTWSALGAGRMLLGVGTNGGQTFTAGGTGGSYAPSMPSHSHTITDPGHSHSYAGNVSTTSQFPVSGGGGYSGVGTPYMAGSTTSSATTGITGTNATSSGDTTVGNLPPYLTVYMWQRTA